MKPEEWRVLQQQINAHDFGVRYSKSVMKSQMLGCAHNYGHGAVHISLKLLFVLSITHSNATCNQNNIYSIYIVGFLFLTVLFFN